MQGCLLYSCHNDSEKIHLNDSFCEISVFLKKVSDDDNDYWVYSGMALLLGSTCFK